MSMYSTKLSSGPLHWNGRNISAMRRCVWATTRCGWPSKRGINHPRARQLLNARWRAVCVAAVARDRRAEMIVALWIAYKSQSVNRDKCHTRRRRVTKSASHRQCSTVVDILSLLQLSHGCQLVITPRPPVLRPPRIIYHRRLSTDSI